MLHRSITILFILIGFCSFSASYGASKAQTVATPMFNIKQSPLKQDWKYFMKANESWRKSLWSYYNRQGKALKDWNWGWRMGWVRKCSESREQYCNTIIKQALFDPAVVVRSESAMRVGVKYRGTKSKAIIKLLTKAYLNKNNFRQGKALFVQQRILFAIHSIGGSYAKKTGTLLSKRQIKSKAYWKLINKAM